MGSHRFENDITELTSHFETVINWIDSKFLEVKNEMKGLEWGRLYLEYGKNPYNPDSLKDEINSLYADESVTNKKGIFACGNVLHVHDLVDYVSKDTDTLFGNFCSSLYVVLME